MIAIQLARIGKPQVDVFSFSSAGHADAEVCNGITGLVATVCAYLFALKEDAGDAIILEVMENSGRIRFDICICDHDESELITSIETVMNLLEIGVQQINFSSGQLDAIHLHKQADTAEQVNAWRKSYLCDRKNMQPMQILKL